MSLPPAMSTLACRRCGLFSAVLDEPITFVNAPAVAQARGGDQ